MTPAAIVMFTLAALVLLAFAVADIHAARRSRGVYHVDRLHAARHEQEVPRC